MFRSRLLLYAGLALSAGAIGGANAQTLRLDPPRTHVFDRPYKPPSAANNYDMITLDLIADGGISTAVSWGTSIHIANTSVLQFVPNFGGANKPFKSLQSFFSVDFSASYKAGSDTLNLSFFNFTPGATLGGDNGPVVLGQFEIQVLQEPGFPDYPDPTYPVTWTNATLSLSAPGIPPNGSAVQDEYGNNLIRNVGGATITSKAQTPEPAAWLTMATGAFFCLTLHRRHARNAKRGA